MSDRARTAAYQSVSLVRTESNIERCEFNFVRQQIVGGFAPEGRDVYSLAVLFYSLAPEERTCLCLPRKVRRRVSLLTERSLFVCASRYKHLAPLERKREPANHTLPQPRSSK